MLAPVATRKAEVSCSYAIRNPHGVRAAPCGSS
jgi:hypothetical protein